MNDRLKSVVSVLHCTNRCLLLLTKSISPAMVRQMVITSMSSLSTHQRVALEKYASGSEAPVRSVTQGHDQKP